MEREAARTAGESGGVFRGSHLALAIVLSAAIIAAAPFLGPLRDVLLGRFPKGALMFGMGAVAALLLAALFSALVRIRRRRRLRYAGLALCVVLVWLQFVGFATGIPSVDVVERVHVLEYGLLAVLFHRAFRPLGGLAPLVLTALSGVLVGTLDEWMQWFVASRVGEVRDVWLNAAAVGTGLLFGSSLLPPQRFRWRLTAEERPTVAMLAAATVLVFGGFYHCAHLGYEIRDEAERLVFRSWFHADDLPEIVAERARRWRAGQRASLHPLRREDYFFLEGVSRVTYRNKSLQRGDVFSAWSEQRILERYYAPVLEQRGLRSGEPLDLQPSEREALRRAAESMAGAVYSSPVLGKRIVVTPSKPTWWTAVLLVAAILLGLALRPLGYGLERSRRSVSNSASRSFPRR